MASVRINVCLPEEIYQHLKEEVKPRETSRFITTAINKMIGEIRQERLAAEYREAAGEMQGQCKDLEGTVGDGID
ncbi:MAG: hypothetical protein WC405_10580 [Syntrophales bacterium]